MSRPAFNPDEPLAYFLTWTTYGTWLPGDDRGWNRRGIGEIQYPNPILQAAGKAKMTESEFRMDSEQRAIVCRTIERHCEVRKWHLHAVNPRTNHVHAVVTAPDYPPDVVLEQFKAWCTRKLREAGLKRRNVWSEGGSKRFVNSQVELETVIAYASEAQDRKDCDG